MKKKKEGRERKRGGRGGKNRGESKEEKIFFA